MLRPENVHSLSDFRQNSKSFIEQMKTSGSPLLLTVNGKAELIVCESSQFQNLLDRLEKSEAETQLLQQKLAEMTEQIAP